MTPGTPLPPATPRPDALEETPPPFEETPGEALKRRHRTMSCLKCRWSSERVPQHVIIMFHRCRPDGQRRRLVELLDDESHSERMHRRRLDWYVDNFGTPSTYPTGDNG